MGRKLCLPLRELKIKEMKSKKELEMLKSSVAEWDTN